ncbi:MAG: glycosyltransferase [Rhodospirillaceae bacterium]|jgi:glycosyltransferase involved in cell wall biosynthesis|nr:glycosyltransferase [Rhodospirillaceae bacterium]MBT5457487.1 glycosyltransferase [Rhodospirillaceae bacterium]
MRVLQTMAGAEAGGAETFFMRLALGLKEHGIEQSFVIRPDPRRERALQASGMAVHTAPFGGLFDLSTRRTLRREIDAFRPEIVISWMNRATAFCPRPTDKSPFVHIGTPRGYYDPKYYRHCDHLVVTTSDLKAFYGRSGWTDERVSVIPNFVPEASGDPLSRKTLHTPDDAPVLLALGRLHENKGFDTLIDAVARLPGHYLWIGGAGPLETDLKQRVMGLDIGDRVRFLGWRDDIPSLFAAADIFVCSSRHEPFGNIVIESWMHGVPIVAAASEGPADLIDDGVNGLLTPLNDSAAMAGAISRLAADPALAAKLVEGGRKTYAAGYNVEIGCRRYSELFERLAG